jgi:hypothetical protein
MTPRARSQPVRLALAKKAFGPAPRRVRLRSRGLCNILSRGERPHPAMSTTPATASDQTPCRLGVEHACDVMGQQRPTISESPLRAEVTASHCTANVAASVDVALRSRRAAHSTHWTRLELIATSSKSLNVCLRGSSCGRTRTWQRYRPATPLTLLEPCQELCPCAVQRAYSVGTPSSTGSAHHR